MTHEFKEFSAWFIDYVGKNHGYNIETATKRKIEKEELEYITKELYKQYGIDDMLFNSNYCETCKEYDEERPYHLDYEQVWDIFDEKEVEKLNKKYWTEEKIKEEKEKKKQILNIIQNIEKEENADKKREAYSFKNLVSRLVDGLEGKNNFMLVKRKYFENIKELEEKEVNAFLNKWQARLDVVEHIEGDRNYLLLEILLLNGEKIVVDTNQFEEIIKNE